MAGFGEISENFMGLFLLMISILLLSSSSSFQAVANDYQVGGKDGWVVKPSEDYNHWAQSHRFQVNDTLRKSNISNYKFYSIRGVFIVWVEEHTISFNSQPKEMGILELAILI